MAALVLDTNLLLLLVVGNGSVDDIDRHKRLNGRYTIDKFELLLNLINRFTKIFVTPHSLAEASNLLDMGKGESLHRAKIAFKALISHAIEVHVEAKNIILEPEFDFLGLSDVAQILVAAENKTLLTADGLLYAQAAQRGLEAINFWHEWEASVQS